MCAKMSGAQSDQAVYLAKLEFANSRTGVPRSQDPPPRRIRSRGAGSPSAMRVLPSWSATPPKTTTALWGRTCGPASGTHTALGNDADGAIGPRRAPDVRERHRGRRGLQVLSCRGGYAAGRARIFPEDEPGRIYNVF